MIAYELHSRQMFLTGMRKKYNGGSHDYPAHEWAEAGAYTRPLLGSAVVIHVSRQNHAMYPIKVLRLSRKVDECEPLGQAAAYEGARPNLDMVHDPKWR